MSAEAEFSREGAFYRIDGNRVTQEEWAAYMARVIELEHAAARPPGGTMTPERPVSRWDEARARWDRHSNNHADPDADINWDWQIAAGELIDDLGDTLDAIDAVLALHQRDEYGRCSVCLDWIDFGEEHMHRWPCPTAAALGAE